MEAERTTRSGRRARGSPESTRAAILEATQKIMLEEGYAAVSTRRVAKVLGLTSAAIHYHFVTTDDMFIALHQSMQAQIVERMKRAKQAEDPLRALWDMQASWTGSALGVEFLALANHRKAIQAMIAQAASDARDAQAAMIQPLLLKSRLDTDLCPPVCLALLLTGLARTLINESSIGLTRGHAETRRFAAAILQAISPSGVDGVEG